MTCTKREKVFLTPKQLSEKYEWPLGGIRHLIFTNKDFESKVVRRVGRKVLVEEGAWLDFIDKEGK